jgi:hypothetical protein
MTVDTFSAQQTKELVQEGEMIDGNRELDMAAVAWTAVHGGQAACRASEQTSVADLEA